ncbi:maleylpyruvate isomerase family mycothiol-dependent enzyme [Streptomyces sp. NPDC059909]|uniref:maleylpyruvate isomerase family mycothiol-dependent enzyme n=1 Tax=Streptomyces sp. NPDC059909 TaxID=3346998 RepID=UPI00366166B4
MESTSGQAQDVRGALPEGLDDAIRGTAEDIAALLRGVADTGTAVPGSQWSLGEAAAHLAQANELMADIAAGRARSHGDGTPQSLAAANEQALAAFDERRADPLAEMIVTQADAFLKAAEGADEAAGRRTDAATPATPLGPMDLAELGSYLLTHMLGHGYDLARALGRPHMIDRARVELTLPFLVTAMPRVVDPAAAAGHTARYAVRLWGGAGIGVTFTDGEVAVGPQAPDRPDCTILTEPVTFLLMALGRCAPWGAIARGRALAWGRKPWLAPRFPTLFVAP